MINAPTNKTNAISNDTIACLDTLAKLAEIWLAQRKQGTVPSHIADAMIGYAKDIAGQNGMVANEQKPQKAQTEKVTMQTMSIAEICTMLNISRTTFYRLRKKGKFPKPDYDEPCRWYAWRFQKKDE